MIGIMIKEKIEAAIKLIFYKSQHNPSKIFKDFIFYFPSVYIKE